MRLDIKTGFKCNNMCRFCAQGHKRNVGVSLAAKEMSRILIDNARLCDGVVFTGGEPTLNSDIYDMALKASELGYRDIQIQTNGRAFSNRSFCRKFVDAGVTDFALALHGHRAELHDYLTRSPGSFDQTTRGIFNLSNMGATVRTNTVITCSNYRHLPEIAKLLTSLNVVQYQFAFVHPIGATMESFFSVVPMKTLVVPYVAAGLSVGMTRGVEAKTEAIPYCFMRGFERCVSEPVIPDTKIYDMGLVIDNYSMVRKKKGKIKGPPCKKCDARKKCEGPWREYPEHYGWEEFIPIGSHVD